MFQYRRRTPYHIDMENVTTAIFYLNTNNGGTKFKTFIKSRANRIVFFNSDHPHAEFIVQIEKRDWF